MALHIAVTAWCVLCLTSFSSGENLVAVRAKNNLPVPLAGMSVFYDGVSDFIYLLGGFNCSFTRDIILRFDISTETVEMIGTMPNPGERSQIAQDSKGNIVYINSDFGCREVYKLNVTDNTVTNMGNITFSSIWSASAKNSVGKVLVFGGIHQEASITEVDIDSDTVQSRMVGRISEGYRYAASAQLANYTALVFGTGGTVPYILLDLETLESSNMTENGFPGFQGGMAVISDNEYVYLIGGDSSTTPAGAMIRLEPATNTWEFISVQNFPSPAGWRYYDAPGSVWVEKQNRIYMFGGQMYNVTNGPPTIVDDIWYINMSPEYTTTISNTITYK